MATGPTGILGVVQTPFTTENEIDSASLSRLVTDALEAGIDGFLVPAVASENAYLSFAEKMAMATLVQSIAAGQVPIFWGTGAFDSDVCVNVAEVAAKNGAAGCLIAVPPSMYATQAEILPYFAQIAAQIKVPIMVQDLQFDGPGMTLETIVDLFEQIDLVQFIKIESAPAGPKYSAVLEATKGQLHVSGGWAIQQMIEALDRGVHAMIPECSMIRIYKKIDLLYRAGERAAATDLFRRLQPVLTFSNQNLDVSIRFFKKLLVRKGIFAHAAHRLTSPELDPYASRIADELIDYVIKLESTL